ncbi:PREDICTED: FHA domain-containing protein At4g14490-like [Nicotiana attenuata]|uniref:Fha domain-containing protein n=1 Tax=Nicotiana attenuata TaxID=49451 RepID=A0A314KZB2_NICAT|nr:PREDICTED: FHA domain-containing protein At4g14490-like [Nicotiana attenuata]XP_019267052.1 PREDICTED: FHA domain-containing protein At4g14490-like [Nicotiana attenuata]OIT34643.1 fha domain-containing protein [Nicotiana attenuata]
MEEPEGPMLHLIMEKGPLSGQKLEYKPGYKIQIGRVVRGNTLPIKDSGISSKHLRIHFQSGSWVIEDLGSSNGTFLNTLLVDPSRPTKLTDGDNIKIGELTSIAVKIEAMKVDSVEEVEMKCKNTRRNPRRKELGVLYENCAQLGFGNGGIENVGVGVGSKRTTRSSKSAENDNLTVIEVEKGRKANPRRTRGSKKEESVKNMVDSVKEAENFTVADVERETKRGRRSRKVESVKNRDDDVEETENLALVDVESELKWCTKRTRGSKKVESVKDVDDGVEKSQRLALVDAEQESKRCTRRTRGSRKVESVKNVDDGVEETKSLAVVDAKQERKPSPRRTRGSRKVVSVKNVDDAKNSVAVDVEREKMVYVRRNKSSRKEKDAENIHENAGEIMELKQLEKGKGSAARRGCLEEEGVMDRLERIQKDREEAVENNADEVAVKLGRESCEVSVSNAGVSISEVQEEKEVDLEKMTLGEWFDYLEVHLPKQIIDATEEMILDMKQKTEKFQEFMLQHKNAKGCDGIPEG